MLGNALPPHENAHKPPISDDVDNDDDNGWQLKFNSAYVTYINTCVRL